MFITIINDCNGGNAVGRQTTRVSSLFGVTPNFVSVNSDVEAAGNLIDILDASEGKKGIVLVNVAPRGTLHKWPNGTPFGFFKYKETTVFSSIDGYTLSLVKKFGIIESLNIFDIPQVVDQLATDQIITPEMANFITHTQFRSFEFLPRVAFWHDQGHFLPSEVYDISQVVDLEPTIWWVDNFGNCKTTFLQEELESFRDKLIPQIKGLPFYEQLTKVPNDSLAITKGSSGLGDKRFLEIAVQKDSASKRLNMVSGQKLIVS